MFPRWLSVALLLDGAILATLSTDYGSPVGPILFTIGLVCGAAGTATFLRRGASR
jgi:hypothetical protein